MRILFKHKFYRYQLHPLRQTSFLECQIIVLHFTLPMKMRRQKKKQEFH